MSSSASVFYFPYRGAEWKGPDPYWPILDFFQYPPDRLLKIKKKTFTHNLSSIKNFHIF
jgi:hypothetical protein